MVTILLVSIFLLFLAYRSIIRRQINGRNAKLAKLFPGPKTVPYFGNSLQLLNSVEASSETLFQYIEEYGSKPFRLWAGSELFVVLSDAEDVKIVTKNVLSKPKDFVAFSDTYGETLFTLTDANEMRRRRRAFIHLFKNRTILEQMTLVNKRIRSESDRLKSYAQTGQIFNVWDHLSLVTFDVVTKSMMDVELSYDAKKNSNFPETNKQSINLSSIRFLSSVGQNKYLDIFFYAKQKRLRRRLYEFIKTIVDTKINEYIKSGIWNNEKSKMTDYPIGETAKGLKIAYDLSLQEKDPSILYNEMLLFIAAATDTVAITSCYTLLLLAIHRSVQDKVYDELYEIFGKNDRDTTSEDLKQMIYTEQAIKEALRMLTTITYVFRYTEMDIQFDDFVLPAGTNIMLFLLGTHYNPKYYPEPHKFNPDNFSAKAVSSRPKCSFIPFVTGPRDCIGKNFAMVELKVIISFLLRKYKFSTNMKMEEIKIKRDFMTSVADNYYPLFIRERN